MENLILKFPPSTDTSNKKPCTCTTSENKQVSCTLDPSTYPRSLKSTLDLSAYPRGRNSSLVHNLKSHPRGRNNSLVYNLQLKSDNAVMKFGGATNSRPMDCKCFPTEPNRPCNTLDCECIARDRAAFTRKVHKPFCPSYTHKEACPIHKINDEEPDPDVAPPPPEEDVVPLPYGLPPIQVGPCPVPGRPCRTDSAARLLKPTAQYSQPAREIHGKVNCSKEYERIKKAMEEFQAELENKTDFKCINKFDVDIEKRCCDDDQRLIKLTGKSCCAEHKLAALALFKENTEREASERRNAMPPT